MGVFPKVRGENNTYIWNHHLEKSSEKINQDMSIMLRTLQFPYKYVDLKEKWRIQTFWKPG